MIKKIQFFLIFFLLVHIILFFSRFFNFGYLNFIDSFYSILLWFNGALFFLLIINNYDQLIKKIFYITGSLTIIWLGYHIYSINDEYNMTINNATYYSISGKLSSHDTYNYKYDKYGFAKPRDKKYKVGPGNDTLYVDLITNSENHDRFVLTCGIHGDIACSKFFSIKNKSLNEIKLNYYQIFIGHSYKNIIISIETNQKSLNFLEQYKNILFIENIICIALLILYLILIKNMR